MLPRGNRLVTGADFAVTSRKGVRRSGSLLTLHILSAPQDGSRDDVAPVVGFVVANTVGKAVVRQKIKRQLRAIVAPMVADMPDGMRVVVRASPAAADATFDELSAAVTRQRRW